MKLVVYATKIAGHAAHCTVMVGSSLSLPAGFDGRLRQKFRFRLQMDGTCLTYQTPRNDRSAIFI